MSKLYMNLIDRGLRTIEDVPLVWRDAVQALIDEKNALQ